MGILSTGKFKDPSDYQTSISETNLGENSVLPWQKTLDPESQKLITRSLSSAGDYEGFLNTQGAKDSAESYLHSNALTPQSTMGMELPGNFKNALEQRLNSSAGQSMSNRKFAQDMEGINHGADALAQGGRHLAANEQIKIQNFQQQLAYQQAVQGYNQQLNAAKSQLVGQIFGGMASIAGVALGGGFGMGKPAAQGPSTADAFASVGQA